MEASEDTRNIIDGYKGWDLEDIKRDLNAKRNNFSVLAVNLELDINIATILRSCNIFAGQDFFIYGRKRINRRGTVGVTHYENISFVPTVDDLDWSKYHVIGIDNIPGAKPIEEYIWDYSKHILLCFGQERVGLIPEIQDKCQEMLYITQYGSCRSLNVGSAASVTFYDYHAKMVRTKKDA